MTDQGSILTIVDSLVAIGTLALAGLTVYQLRLFIQERKANQARELAERVYTPLRMEVALWVNPEFVFGFVSSKAWIELKEKAPYLVLRLPRDLVNLLDTPQPLLKTIEFLGTQVRGVIRDITDQVGIKLCAQARVTFRGPPFIRVLGKSVLITTADIGTVWAARMSLKDWVEKYVNDHYPVKDWEVEVLSGSDRIGGLTEAEEITEAVFATLKNQPFACELLNKIYELQGLAQKAISQIDEELSKRIAPWE
jgi:hypothetical protein